MKYLSITIIFIFWGCHDNSFVKSDLEGQPMPQFKLLLTDSSTFISSSSSPDAKPIVVYYFSPYCPYCKQQTQKIIEKASQLQSIQFYFVSNFSLKEIQTYYNHYNLKNHNNIITGKDINLDLANNYMLKFVPLLVVYGKDKHLVGAFQGVTEIDRIKQKAFQ